MTGKDARGFVRVQAEAEKAMLGSNLFRKLLTWMLVQEDAEEEDLLRGRVKSRSFREEMALDWYESALFLIENVPSEPSGWFHKARSLQMLGDYAAALAAAEHALELAPKNSVYRANCDEIRYLLATTPPNASKPGEWKVGDEGPPRVRSSSVRAGPPRWPLHVSYRRPCSWQATAVLKRPRGNVTRQVLHRTR